MIETEAVYIATSTSTLTHYINTFNPIQNIVAPFIVGVLLMLLERWFSLSRLIIKESSTEKRILQKIKGIIIFGSNNKIDISINNPIGFPINDASKTSNPLNQPTLTQQPTTQNILTPTQIAICDAILKFSTQHTSTPCDFKNDYEKFKKQFNSGDILLGAGTFFKIFNHMANIFEKVLVIKSDLGQEIGNLKTLVNGLDAMLKNPSTININEEIKKQVEDCEAAAMQLINHLPYEPN